MRKIFNKKNKNKKSTDHSEDPEINFQKNEFNKLLKSNSAAQPVMSMREYSKKKQSNPKKFSSHTNKKTFTKAKYRHSFKNK